MALSTFSMLQSNKRVGGQILVIFNSKLPSSGHSVLSESWRFSWTKRTCLARNLTTTSGPIFQFTCLISMNNDTYRYLSSYFDDTNSIQQRLRHIK